MTTYVALLRAINVGGHNRVAMADLRAAAAELGLEEPRTLLQSGNLIFRASRRATATIERELEEMASRALGLEIDMIVRDAKEWRLLMTRNPFADLAGSAPSRLIAMPLKSAPTAAQLTALRESIAGEEQVHLEGSDLYVAYPAGMGTSKLNNTVIERKLATRGTARNWNTVVKIAEMIGE